MTLYIVTEGEYSDYHIEGVFSTKEKAQHYISLKTDEYLSYSINEWELDEPDAPAPYYVCWYNHSNETVKVMFIDHVEYEDELDHPFSRFIFWISSKHPAFMLPDEDREKVLLKIGQDRYAKYKAKEEGIT